MKTTFPYLSFKNIGRLFSRQRMALKPGSNGDAPAEVPHLAPTLKGADKHVLDAFGRLAAKCLSAPGSFICSPEGDIVWQNAAQPIELDGLRSDILTHIGGSAGGEVAMVRPHGNGKGPSGPPNGEGRFCAIAPLRVRQGGLVGALCVVDNKDRALSAEEKDFLKSVATQLMEELELEETVHECSLCHGAIQNVGRFFMCEQAERWLGKLAMKLAELAHVEYAVIMERSPKQPAVARTLAVSFQGGLLENFDYPLEHSPLGGTKPGDMVRHSKDVPQLFAEDSKLRALKIEGFAAVALPSGPAGHHAGAWILLMDRKPFENPPLVDAVLGAAACPLAARLEQVKLQNLLESEARRHEGLVEHALEGFYRMTPEGRMTEVNPAMAKMLGYDSPQAMLEATNGLVNKIYAQPEMHKEMFEKLRAKDEIFEERIQAIQNHGGRVWFAERIRRVCDAEGKIIAYEGFAEDVTARVVAEESFRSSEARFQALFQHAHAGFALADRQRMITKVNPAFARLLGYSEAELRHKSLSEMSDGNGGDSGEDASLYDECTQGKRDRFQAERRWMRKDKTAVWVRLTVSSVRDRDGALVSMVVMAEDLTPQKDADESLRSKDALWHAVFENATLGVALLDGDGNLSDYNPALRELIGVPEGKKNGKTMADIVHADDRDACAKLIQDCVQNRRDHAQMECRLARKNGRMIWTLLTMSAARQPDGGLKHLAAMFEDITLRKEAEKALSECDEPIQAMLDAAGVGMAFADESGSLRKTNKALQEFLGYSRDSLLSKSLEDITVADDKKLGADLHKELREGKRSFYQIEKRLVRKDRSTVWARLSFFALKRADGSPLSMIVMVEDAGDRRKMEEALRLSHQRMEALFEAEGWAVSFLDIKGEFTNSSLSFQKLLGYSGTELKLKSFSDLAHPDDRDSIKKHESVLAQGKFTGFELECRLLRKNGGIFWARITVSRLPGKEESDALIGVVEDITLRKESVEALAETRARYAGLFDHSMFGVALINPAGFLMMTNPALEDMLGDAREVLHGKLFTERVLGEDMPGYVAAKEECMEGDRDGFQMELRILGKSQQPVWVRLKATAIRRADDSLDSMLVMLENLTAWKETEESLKENWEKLRATEQRLHEVEEELATEQTYFRVLFDGAGMGIALVDRDDRLLEANPSLERMLGYDSGELQGKKLEDISHPDDNKLSAKCHRQCLDGQLPHYEIEKCLRSKTQGLVWVRMTVATITRPDGSMESAYATFEDITPKKNAEMALAASQGKVHLAETQIKEGQERFRDVFNGVGVGVAVLDKDGRLVETNSMLQEMFGMSGEELASKKLADVVHPDDMGGDGAAFQECVDGKRQELEFEKRFVKGDKSDFLAEFAATVVRDEDGMFKYVVGVVVPFAQEDESGEKPVEMTDVKSDDVPATSGGTPETGDVT